MYQTIFMELLDSGPACIPGYLFKYSAQLRLELEDFGLLSIIFYYLSGHYPGNKLNSVPGITIEEIRKIVPEYSMAKLKKRLLYLSGIGLVTVTEDVAKRYVQQRVSIEPLFEKLAEYYFLEHPEIDRNAVKGKDLIACEKELDDAKTQIELLNQELRQIRLLVQPETRELFNTDDIGDRANEDYLEVENFIARYTGKLISSAMAQKLKSWIFTLRVDSKFLIAIIEMCFERGISSPATMDKYIEEISVQGIHTIDGLKGYFTRIVDNSPEGAPASYGYDLEILELAKFLNIDMRAKARRNMYYKWRNEWGFSHEMIMKAGEIMSTRVNQGGLEYMDRILQNWKTAGIDTLQAVEKEQNEYRLKTPTAPVSHGKTGKSGKKEKSGQDASDIYIPRELLKK